MSQSIDVIFCRRLLRDAAAAVKLKAPDVDLTDAWVWSSDRKCWEFHGPENFYWYGRAHNAYEARYKGWMAWLTHKFGDNDDVVAVARMAEATR